MNDNIKTNSLEELVNEFIKAKAAVEEYEAMQKVIKDEIADRLRELKVTGTKVGQFFCYQCFPPIVYWRVIINGE